MNRRDFLASSTVGATLAGVNSLGATDAAAAEQNGTAGREVYDLRFYNMNPGGNPKPLLDYLQNAALPALNRLGASKVGVFTELGKADSPFVCVLIPYPSIDAFFRSATELGADPAYQKAAAAYLSLLPSAAAYARLESSLMIAFEGMPKLVLPSQTTDKKSRIFELRIYESHNERAGRKKIEMFNKGEIDIMHRVGLGPVFYGETIIGTKMPNLTYMLSGENMDMHKQHWGAFGGDAEWRKISAIPEYSNAAIISRISNKFLTPVEFSQI